MSRKVEFGVYLPSAGTGTGTVDRAKLYEELGFHTVWTSDLIDPGVLECMTLTAAVATATTRIRVGIGVVNLMYRTPMLLLRSLASLDQLSAGRLSIGLGVGVAHQFDAYGLTAASYADRVAQLGETLEVLPAHFAGPSVDYEGEHVRFSGVDPRPLGVQTPRPPILIGGGSARMLRLAARYADLWEIGGWRSYLEHENESKLSVAIRKRAELDAACVDIGRDPAEIKTVVDFWFTMAETREGADAAAERARAWESLYELHGGTPDQVQRQLEEYVDAGVDHIILSFLNLARGETPRLFNRVVAPAFDH